MSPRYPVALLVLACIIQSCGSAPSGEPPAAIIAGDTITREAITAQLESFRGDSARIESVLENFVNGRLVLADAMARELDQTPDIQRYRYEREREQLQNTWMPWYINQMVEIDHDTVRAFYEGMGTMVIYKVMNVQDRALCDSLRGLTLEGNDLGELVREHSTIAWDVQSNGSVGPVDLMRASTGDRQLLQGLGQGDVSPVDTFPSGWRFLKVDSIYQDSVPPFEEISDFIASYLRSHEMEIYKQFMEDSLREANHLTVIEGIPELVALHAIGDTGEYEPYSPEEEAMPAYTFDGGSRTLISLVENVRNLPPQVPRTPTDPEWVRNYSNLLGLYDIMAMEGRRQGMDTLSTVTSVVERSFTSRLLDDYYDLVIAPRLVPTEAQLQGFFQENADMFRIEEMRTFLAISAFGTGQLDLLEGIISSGADPFGRSSELTLMGGLTAPGESLLTAPLKDSDIPAPWDTLLFSAEIGEMVLCTLSTDRVLVFQLQSVSPEHAASFAEAEEDIIRMLSQQNEEEVVGVLVDSLRSVYHNEVDMDFIRGFYEGQTEDGDAGQSAPVAEDGQTEG